MKKLNWGIIGVGWIAHEMADALNQVNGEIYAATAPTAAHLAKFAAEKHVLHTYTNADAMLNDPNVDVVYIATPHTFHYEYIKKALLAGKHVFCEKAITVNAHQFDEVAALARKKNLILSEGFTLYHMPIYKQPKRGVVSGTKGYVEIDQYPRATEAQITYTSSAHGETHTTLTAGVSADALVYEVQDMQRYIEQGHDDGELALSHDVAHLLDSVRTAWGMRYPFDNK